MTRRIAGETVLVPVRSGLVDLDFLYTSNETGAMILEWIDGQKNVDQIVDTICREYDVSPQEAAKDIIDFVGALEAAGLVGPAESLE